MRKGEVWAPEYGFRGVLYIVNTAGEKMAVVYPQGHSDEEAIARLIAAAPEMLELLQSIVNDYDANSGIAGEEDAENLLDAFRQIHKEASRLVSKATGE